jgi:hypothetical protein
MAMAWNPELRAVTESLLASPAGLAVLFALEWEAKYGDQACQAALAQLGVTA